MKYIDLIYLDEWKSLAEGQGYEIEYDEDMQAWFAWKGDDCVGAFNLENVKGHLEVEADVTDYETI